MAKRGFALDTKPTGFGLIRLGHHAIALHVDPLKDALFMVLDANIEPDDTQLPIRPAPIAIGTRVIYEFDAHPTLNLTYSWKGKLNLLAYGTTMHFAKVEGEEFNNSLLRVIGDGTMIYQRVIASNTEFRIRTGGTNYATYETQMLGTSRIRSIQVTQDVMELD